VLRRAPKNAPAEYLPLAVGGDRAAALEEALLDVLEAGGANEVAGPHLGGGGPLLDGGRQQALVVVSQRFVRQFHGASVSFPRRFPAGRRQGASGRAGLTAC
jgi:hypothetical protein